MIKSLVVNNPASLLSRAYRPAESGERACNSHRPFTDGKMQVVTNFRTRFEWQHLAGLGCHSLIRKLLTLFLVTTSISPSVKGL